MQETLCVGTVCPLNTVGINHVIDTCLL